MFAQRRTFLGADGFRFKMFFLLHKTIDCLITSKEYVMAHDISNVLVAEQYLVMESSMARAAFLCSRFTKNLKCTCAFSHSEGTAPFWRSPSTVTCISLMSARCF